MADIFLSYAREDVAQARRLAQALESRGWSVWWDRRIPHGQNFTASIQKELDAARCIAVLWSSAAIASSFVLDEAAEGLGGRLVPVLIEKVKQPLGFRQFQAADLTDWSGDASHDEFGRLVASITTIVLPRPAVAPALAIETGTVTTAAAPPMVPDASQGDVDVYVDYSPMDDIELVEGRPGWVRNFARALEVRLSQLVGRQVRVAMNRAPAANRSPSDSLDTVRRAACFVAIMSPRFIRSDSTRRELNEFLSVIHRQGHTHPGTRLFKVLKTPVPVDAQPVELQAVIAYEFFKIDPDTGRVRELDELFGPEAQREFWLKLDDLAHDVCAALNEYQESRSQRPLANPGSW